MKKEHVFLIFTLLLSAELLTGQEKCELIPLKGEIAVREPFQEIWLPVNQPMLLKDRITVLSRAESMANIRDYTGRLFVLPSKAQVEVRELKHLDRNALIMELTAMEMQKLPAGSGGNTSETAFILHGNLPDPQADDFNRNDYIVLERNGARSLYSQGYISGFILKTNRLMMLFPTEIFPDLEKMLIQAYDKMALPVRKQQLVTKIQNRSKEQ